MKKRSSSESWDLAGFETPDPQELDLISMELASADPHVQSEATDEDDADFGFLLEYDDDNLKNVIRAA